MYGIQDVCVGVFPECVGPSEFLRPWHVGLAVPHLSWVEDHPADRFCPPVRGGKMG